ncbi:hypothetical protein STCU_10877 [Strigomonas culicis]|uniref:Uncharacterized protein n=1 Tax=Strigomonas culicis TaxID=28005 RepID=S9TKX6_9TRYP|nr:hypothetical protein STCU_10877 [Strigomonas culicis]|eukprot:EPY16978.1 hypothetical protein STCU_10877 [Strigomonas culicis]
MNMAQHRLHLIEATAQMQLRLDGAEKELHECNERCDALRQTAPLSEAGAGGSGWAKKRPCSCTRAEDLEPEDIFETVALEDTARQLDATNKVSIPCLNTRQEPFRLLRARAFALNGCHPLLWKELLLLLRYLENAPHCAPAPDAMTEHSGQRRQDLLRVLHSIERGAAQCAEDSPREGPKEGEGRLLDLVRWV